MKKPKSKKEEPLKEESCCNGEDTGKSDYGAEENKCGCGGCCS